MKNIILEEEIQRIKNIESKYGAVFETNEFLDYREVYAYFNNLLPSRYKFKFKYLLKISLYSKYNTAYKRLLSILDNLENDINIHNKSIFENKKDEFNSMCGLIENKELDDQQIDAIVRENKNQLVIAGAGSGKTTTIVGKVKYLLKTKKYNPEDILLLSFTNASASEMKERIKKETNIDLDVMTFHKLGLEIIKSSLGENVNVFDKELYQEVKRIIENYINDSEYLNKLIYFMITARFKEKDEFDFTDEAEYEDYLSTNAPVTLNGERVKSYGELLIANYLFCNGIEYKYEKAYKFDTMTMDYQQYTPDFYLPEYDIYIEYFGIDENNQVAPYFTGRNGKTPSETYNESIKWKRKTHKKYNTTMIETFYYENKKGILIQNLEEKLTRNSVKINPKNDQEIWEIINSKNKGLLNEICNVFATIINLIKSNGYVIEQVERFPQVMESETNKLTIELIKPLYYEYQKQLHDNDMIDFNDMINMATDFVNANRFIHDYKYVIVDEYQDMSNSRYRLLNSMRNQKNYKLFCVGDDWQSIYRFNGSDIDLITNFEKYWGNTYISFIEKTYRFTSMMSILSGNFIMKNPHQYRKNIHAKISDDFAIKFVNAYTEDKCIDFLEEKLRQFDSGSSVYFLGRYSFDIDILKGNSNFKMSYNTNEGLTDITYFKRKDLRIKFLTVHKSKGLQADYVVILNNKNYGMGFPSKMNDLPLIRILLASGLDDYPFSEERRLFYVALTRSRKQTLLLTIDSNKSIFAMELESDSKNLLREDWALKDSIYRCPKCGGKLVPKSGKYGKFLGCSNYPDCTYTKNY